ncbi:MAG: J domain-containing protein [Blautia sp.]|nr:J domain-containing protein [Blautia sp.]
MFRTIWDWLEIDATRDRDAIRKAYARQSKKYHPEDMPEEARLLREAYKQALSLADGAAGSMTAENAGNGLAQRGGKGGDSGGGGQDEKSADSKKNTDTGQYRHGEKSVGTDYHYGHQGKMKTLETPPEREDAHHWYRYGTGRHEAADDSAKPENGGYQYHYKTQAEKQVPPGSGFAYYQLDGDRTERLEQFEKQMDDLCHSAARDDISLWADAVRKCLTAEDLKDTHMIAAALSVLTQLRGMDDHIWYILGKELFRYGEKSAEWTWLKSRFAEIRRENGVLSEEDARLKRNIVIARQIDPKTGQTIPENPAPKSHGYVKYIIIALMIIDFVATLVLAYIFS